MKTRTKKTLPAKKPPALERPTFEDVRRVVLAWLAANHPEADDVTLTEWNEWGAGTDLATIVKSSRGESV